MKAYKEELLSLEAQKIFGTVLSMFF